VGTIFVVRHGQAAFGTDQYDRLTELGVAQSRLLGAYLAARRLRFDAVLTGTLRRQVDTAQGIFDGGPALGAHLSRETCGALDEYDAEAILRAHGGAAPTWDAATARRDPDAVREHFRRLRDALLAWTEDRIQPIGMPTFAAFQAGAVAVLDAARRRCAEGNVLVVSSGGPIAAMVAASLDAPRSAAVQLNLRIRNSALTEFTVTARRHHLSSFNAVAHLETRNDPGLVTYA
jgi:broad specificity phosphatase PhoE